MGSLDRSALERTPGKRYGQSGNLLASFEEVGKKTELSSNCGAFLAELAEADLIRWDECSLMEASHPPWQCAGAD
ncbi:MAG: hypothetical protein R3D98_15415 [Candidatus Krumholzibacteriia bacterium]